MASLTLIQGEALPVDDRVRAVVRMLLAAAGMKPVDLAERIGLSKNQVWDRLRGDKPFSVAEVVGMAEVFDVPPSVFLMGPRALLGSAEGSITVRKSTQSRDLPVGALAARRPTLSLVAA